MKDPSAISVLEAPAKLNLILQVVGRREDGYHLLSMLNVTTGLADKLYVRSLPDSGVRLTVSGASSVAVPEDAQCEAGNLAARAASAFFARAEHGAGLEIELEKHIPAGAGLGGGSSDAAAVLRYLWENSPPGVLSHEALNEVAVSLGADVPYLLYGGPALVGGVGDVVSPLALTSVAALPVTLLLPPWAISTAEVFAVFRRSCSSTSVTDPCLQDSFPAIEDLPRLLHNDLEPAASKVEPRQQELIEVLREGFGAKIGMSGSGSALFFFPEHEAPGTAEQVRAFAEAHGCRVIQTQLRIEGFRNALR